MKKRVIATVSIGQHGDLFTLARPNLEAYAKLHGYEISNCGESLDDTRPPAWTKVLHIINLMESYKEILWIDSDAIVLDETEDISSIVDKDSDLGWVYHEYDNQSHPNSGVMFIRVNSSTERLFKLASEQRDLDHHPWWDQAALMRVLGLESSLWPIGQMQDVQQVAIKEQKLPIEWNSIRQNAAREPRIRHFAGEQFWVRKFLMAEYSNPTGNSNAVITEILARIDQIEKSNHSLEQQNHSLEQHNSEITNSRTWRLFSFWRVLRRKIV